MKDTQAILFVGAILAYYIWTQSAKTTATRKGGAGQGKGSRTYSPASPGITGPGNNSGVGTTAYMTSSTAN